VDESVDRLTPGLLTLGLGFAAAFALLIPFIAISYRRRGGLAPGRTVAWLALLLWVLGMWAHTLLPLPDDGYRCAGVVLDPLQGVALFVPWGFLVRALPCAYRFFDTGDLLTNTTGALLGSLAALLRRAPRRPNAADWITLSRRLIGTACDAIIAWSTAAIVTIALNSIQVYLWEVERTAIDYTLSAWVAGVTTFAAVGALVLATGTTPGEAAVNIVGVDAPTAVMAHRMLRYLAGIGGFQLVTALPEGWGSLAAFAFIVASVVVTWRTSQHRGRLQHRGHGHPAASCTSGGVPQLPVEADPLRVGLHAVGREELGLPTWAIVPVEAHAGHREIGPAVSEPERPEIDVARPASVRGDDGVGCARVAVAHHERIHGRHLADQRA
jgi:hypothetical protein